MQKKFNSKIQESVLLIAILTGLTWGITSAQAAVDSAAPEAFKKLDIDGDGYVTAREAVSGELASEAFIAADRDKDGKLDTNEYVSSGLDKSGVKAQ
jgi:Ca2+-binding EF-hand superfamily protein